MGKTKHISAAILDQHLNTRYNQPKSNKTEVRDMLNENKAYELALSSGATLINGKLNVKTGISPELLAEVQDNKEALINYMSGHCFGFQVSYHMAPTQWVVAKVPNIADVDFPPEEVFEGSAHEVDTWCSDNKDDPLFTNDYTCKYTIYHR